MRQGVLVLAILLSAVAQAHQAPVVEAWSSGKAASRMYRVQKGDTLYSIAFAFNQDYHHLAEKNHLKTSTPLRVGQWLQMSGVDKSKSRHTARSSHHKVIKTSARKQVRHHRRSMVKHKQQQHKRSRQHPDSRYASWHWPSRGTMVSPYSGSYEGNRGVDIKGYYGSPVRAAASGVVVYVGQGVRGYPRLIILKHNRHYLSAYSNNARILVKQGQAVRSGQTIAKMGRDTAGRTRLHFELRRNGQPVNPMYVLPRGRV